MIVVKCWKHIYKWNYKGAYSIWQGVFLLGIIPLYLRRAKIVK